MSAVPQLKWPLQIERTPDGRPYLATVPQDSDLEIRQNLAILASLTPGDLPWDQEAGITPLDPTEPAASRADDLTAQLQELEPRAEGLTVEIDESSGSDSRSIRLIIQ